jgi:hypothetical protein
MESTEEIIFKTYNNINSKLIIIKKINIVVVVVVVVLAQLAL